VFARGTTSIGPLHRGPGEINYPICCGGTVVHPGDVLVADNAGIVVIPWSIADELLGRLKAHHAANEAYLAGVRRGQFSNAWVDATLEEAGCPIIREEVGKPETADEWADSHELSPAMAGEEQDS
jgi:regulator of RNase E activity RraA